MCVHFNISNHQNDFWNIWALESCQVIHIFARMVVHMNLLEMGNAFFLGFLELASRDYRSATYISAVPPIFYGSLGWSHECLYRVHLHWKFKKASLALMHCLLVQQFCFLPFCVCLCINVMHAEIRRGNQISGSQGWSWWAVVWVLGLIYAHQHTSTCFL